MISSARCWSTRPGRGGGVHRSAGLAHRLSVQGGALERRSRRDGSPRERSATRIPAGGLLHAGRDDRLSLRQRAGETPTSARVARRRTPKDAGASATPCWRTSATRRRGTAGSWSRHCSPAATISSRSRPSWLGAPDIRRRTWSPTCFRATGRRAHRADEPPISVIARPPERRAVGVGPPPPRQRPRFTPLLRAGNVVALYAGPAPEDEKRQATDL